MEDGTPLCPPATRWAAWWRTGETAGAILLLPMKRDHEAIGGVAIWLTGGREPVGAARPELMEALDNAAPRIARALLADQAKHAATVDPLTGLPNRRGFDETFRLISAREGALVYADMDRFKSLNDALGHPAGDAALVHFARILREQIRTVDVAGRIGGEEFAVWLPETGLDLGGKIAERIRIKLGTTAWDWRGRQWPLSASFGVAAAAPRPAGASTTCRPRPTRPCTWPSGAGGTGWRRRGGDGTAGRTGKTER